jgi:hypothetical protein
MADSCTVEVGLSKEALTEGVHLGEVRVEGKHC